MVIRNQNPVFSEDIFSKPSTRRSNKTLPSDNTLLLESYNFGKANSKYKQYENIGAVMQKLEKTIGYGLPSYLPGWNLSHEQLMSHKFDGFLVHAAWDAYTRLSNESKDHKATTIFCPLLPDNRAAQVIVSLGLKRYVYDERAVEEVTKNDASIFHNALVVLKKANVALIPSRPNFEHTFLFRGLEYKIK
jgi:deoxycytidylate deaminase